MSITRDDNRIAYLAGDGGVALSPDERAELDHLRSLLEDPATWAEPDPRLEERVVAGIGAAAGREAAARRVGRLGRPSQWHRMRSLVRRRPRLALGALAATLAAVLAVLVVLVFNATSKHPLRFTMAVTGSSLAPGVHGTATFTRTTSGWRIELRAPGLTHLGGGRYYEAWVTNSAGLLVPLGTFNDARRVVTLSSGVPVSQFRSLTVTLERADGNQTSSGRTVLTGTVR